MQVTDRKPQVVEKEETYPIVMDYDLDNYDYRVFWQGRDYEQWAETRVLKRLLDRVGQAQWLVDFGGGFGRNTVHYIERADHAVLVDYSMGNLQRAATSTLAGEVETGHLFLVRADLYRLPFVDGAFDVGLIVRVLHHLAQVDDALGEMGRTLAEQWILDVPIKHHLLAHMRGLLRGETPHLVNWEPKALGTPQEPFVNFHLAAIRRTLADHKWESRVVASANNFRRWDQVLSPGAITALRPLVYGLEAFAQTVGRGWWGPSQFVWARRRAPGPAAPTTMTPPATLGDLPWAALATKMICPSCHGPLQWASDAASCPTCVRAYPRMGFVWDFVPS